VDTCASGWDSTLERRADGEPALRLGLRVVKSLSQSGADRLVAARAERPFASVQDLATRAALDRGDLEALASAGALASLSGNRHLAFWQVVATERPVPLGFASARGADLGEGRPLITAPSEAECIAADYASLGLTLGRHPLALLRARLAAAGLSPASEVARAANGASVRTAGIVLMRQRPSTASGVTFVTLEDESGQVNVIVWERVGSAQRRALIESRLLEVHGELQQQDGVTHLIARRLIDRSALLGGAAEALAGLYLPGPAAAPARRIAVVADLVILEIAGELGGVLVLEQPLEPAPGRVADLLAAALGEIKILDDLIKIDVAVLRNRLVGFLVFEFL